MVITIQSSGLCGYIFQAHLQKGRSCSVRLMIFSKHIKYSLFQGFDFFKLFRCYWGGRWGAGKRERKKRKKGKKKKKKEDKVS